MSNRLSGSIRSFFTGVSDFGYHRLRGFTLDKAAPMVSRLRRLKLRTRLIISFSALSLIPLITVSIFAYQYNKSVFTKLGKSSYQLLEQLDKNIQTEIGKCEHVCDQLATDSDIQDSLLNFSSLDESAKRERLIRINDSLGKRGLILPYMQNIYIFTKERASLFDLGYDSFDDASIQRFIKGTDAYSPLDYWTYARTRRGMDCLVLCRAINLNQVSDTAVKLGYLFVVINNSWFSTLTYTYVDMGKGSNVMLLDETGLVISRIDPNMALGKVYPDGRLFPTIRRNQKKSSNAFTIRLQGQRNLVLYLYNSRIKWYLTATIPYSYIRSEAAGINTWLFLICISCLLFSIIVSFIITLSIDTPIRRMVNTIQKVSAGNLDQRIQDTYHDEMGYLSQNFDAMIGQLENLNRRYQEDQKRKRELELNMLQAQINPHFLFNTLNSLKWTAQMSRVTTVSDGLGALADLLQNTIINKNELIPLSEELRNLENYLLIQKIRYGDSFRVVFEIEEELRNNLILKFLLQPIVENSIIHGLSDSKKQVTIRIQGFQDGDGMTLIIRDDGKGFEVDKLNELHSGGLGREKLSKIGIENVRERIILHFGEKYGLVITSAPGAGTEVVMRLPRQGRDEGR